MSCPAYRLKGEFDLLHHLRQHLHQCLQERQASPSRGSGVRLGFKSCPDSGGVGRLRVLWFHRISHTWNASRSALVVHPFT